MRHTAYRWLALASLLLLVAAAHAASRPHYGGTLRVQMRGMPRSLDPALTDNYTPRAAANEKVAIVLFDRLVQLDRNGAATPSLATNWQGDANHRRWQFWMRRGVVLHNGSSLTFQQVAASIATANPSWRVAVIGDSISIETDAPMPNLPAVMALPHNSIVVRGEGGAVVGSGPFRVAEWQPQRRLAAVAHDEHWAGRPFLDRIEFEFGRRLRDQVLDFELGKADLIEAAAELEKPPIQSPFRLISTPASHLLVLMVRERQPASAALQGAFRSAIDREQMETFLLQKQGAPAWSLLPQWLTGYAYLFRQAADPSQARRSLAGTKREALLPVAYDASDPLSRAAAERISLLARDIGLNVQPLAQVMDQREEAAPLRVVLVRIASEDKATALQQAARALGSVELPAEAQSASLEDLFVAERQLLESAGAIPLVHLSERYAVTLRVKNFIQSPSGSWSLDNVWLEQRP